MKIVTVLSQLAALGAAAPVLKDSNGEPIMNNDAKALLQESLTWMDMYYDIEVSYLYNLDSKALLHDTRSSVRKSAITKW